MNFKDIKSKLIKCLMPDIKWNINTKTSVSGLFGAGCFVSWALAAEEICKKERSSRKIGTCIITGIVFGGVHIYLNNRQNQHEVNLARIKHPGVGSEQVGSQGTTSATRQKMIPPEEFIFSQDKKPKEYYDKRQLVGKIIGIEDICIIYCETGVGKSVLAFQIANDIAIGKYSAIQPNDLGLHIPQPVLYSDCELKESDYYRRYPDYEQPANLHILRGFFFNEAQEWLEDIEKRIFEFSTDITVILDNITGAFRPLTSEEMRRFIEVGLGQLQKKAVAKGFYITFIIIAHTTKEGNLGGSMNFQNFATSIVHLLPGADDNHKILKIDKCRNYGEIMGKRFLLRESEDGIKHLEFDSEIDADESPKDAKAPVTKQERNLAEAREIKKFLDAGHTKIEAHAKFGWTRPTIDKRLKLLNP